MVLLVLLFVLKLRGCKHVLVMVLLVLLFVLKLRGCKHVLVMVLLVLLFVLKVRGSEVCSSYGAISIAVCFETERL